MSPILILIAGALAVGLFYIPFGVEYWRKRDDFGLGVTAAAAFATLLPFLGFAMLAQAAATDREMWEQRATADAAFERQMGDLIKELEANAQVGETRSDETPQAAQPVG